MIGPCGALSILKTYGQQSIVTDLFRSSCPGGKGKELSREEQYDGLKEFEVTDSGPFKVSLQKSRGKGEKEKRAARLTHEKLGNTDDSVRIHMREMGDGATSESGNGG